MKTSLIMLSSLLLVACTDAEFNRRFEFSSKFKMDCTLDLLPNGVDTGYSMRRCENNEVVCYTRGNELQCRFKTP